LERYLIGDYDGSSRFWLSTAATPPPGPGNPDVTAPLFTNSDTFTVNENVAVTFDAATITVDDSATISIAAGIDGALFNIVIAGTSTAYLRFKASPDFEAATDVGGNNIYNITITTTDSLGNSRNRTFAIVVTNLNESSTTSAPGVIGTAYKGIITTLTVTVNAPGRVRFFLSGKKIPGCLYQATSGTYPNYTATCQWKPPVMGYQNLTAQLTPSDSSFSSSTSSVGRFWVYKRTTRR
jgi:serralysin